MKKKISIFLVIIFFIMLLCNINTVNADDSYGIMKVYKLKIKLLNLDTTEYSIELYDYNLNRIYETQEGNETGEHNFAIATEMDERHLVNYGINIKYADGDVKTFKSININKLVDLDDDKTDSTYSYEYNLKVKLLPNWLIITIMVIVAIALVITSIMALKKHKRRIK